MSREFFRWTVIFPLCHRKISPHSIYFLDFAPKICYIFISRIIPPRARKVLFIPSYREAINKKERP